MIIHKINKVRRGGEKMIIHKIKKDSKLIIRNYARQDTMEHI